MPTAYQVLVNFDGSDGAGPAGSVLDLNNVLYGTTSSGGLENAGGIFVYSIPGGALDSFTSFSASNGTDGNFPQAGLTDVKGTLYGTTAAGGTSAIGAIFAYNTSVNTQQTVVSFNGLDGKSPEAPLTDVNGILYGTTFEGGSAGDGTLFAFNPSTRALQTLVNISTPAVDGANPAGALTDVNGVLYGTMSSGGPAGDGTLFDYNIATGKFQTLVDFTGSNGRQPMSSLTDVNGVLYGTTLDGGPSVGGTLFAYHIADNTLQTLVNFGSPQLETNNNTGLKPAAGVTDINGTLYGTTEQGGTASAGTLYAYNIATGALQTPVNFNTPGFGGGLPSADLLDVNGTLYGSTVGYGPNNDGVLFSYTPPCFVTGTRIATARGPVAVEALRTGGVVMLAEGGTLPVRWIGCRQVACAAHADPHSVWPVRIAAGAFGAAGPAHDLYLSPDHAVFIDGALIPAKHLIDGNAVARVACDTVTYWHVELPRHAVLLAEGLACESFLDTQQRRGDYVTRVWEAEGCAELVVTGPRLDTARARIATARARLSGARAA